MTSARRWLATRVVLPLSDRVAGRRVSSRLAHLRAQQWWSAGRIEADSVSRLRSLLELPAWRDGGVVHVERKAPIATQTGKIRHFHLERLLGSAGPPRSRA